MKLNSFAATAGAAAVALGIWLAPGTMTGQPLYDRIKVELPYKIVLGDKTMQPGEYTIQQLPDTGGGSRVLLFYTNNGMKFETSAMTIPALDPNTARDTKLILGHVGDDYYINKIWVQGKDYGYELPIPKALKDRQNEKTSETTVAAQYQPSTETTTETTTAQTATPPPTTPDTTTSAQTTAQPTPPPVTSETNTSLSASQQTTPSPTTPPQTTTPAPDPSADRAMPEQTPTSSAPATMPHTAANWLLMLLSGGTLSGAGLMLNRKRR